MHATVLCLSLSATLPVPSGATADFAPAVFGLELPVKDVVAAERLYREAFGFASVFQGGEVARLELDGLALVLVASPAANEPEDAARVYLNLEVGDLEASVLRAEEAGMLVPDLEPRRNPIGHAVTVFDADGHGTNLIRLDRTSTPGAEGPRVFNVGLDLEAGADWEFVERLGFRVLTRAYLPEVLPIERAGAAELVLHRRAARARQASTKAAALLLGVDSLDPALEALAARELVEGTPRSSTFGRRASLRTPSRVRVELIERSPAQLAFERLCALAGTWEGKSSQGWTSRTEIQVIARGSVVVERTNFEAHPGETMMTMFAMDQGELGLTHYCVAGNQPHLVATEIAEDGGRLAFSFKDGGNLASRDQGHMDSAVITLVGPDEMSSVWTWYQSGQSSWLEEIRYRRVEAGREEARAAKAGAHH
jgi:hypothetical protein